jgi:hypothetical protein
VVNASLAEHLFPGGAVVGRTFSLDRYIGRETHSTTAVVVGVAGDTRSSEVREAPRAKLYHAGRATSRSRHVLVRSDEPADVVMTRIRAVVHEVDAALPITSLGPLRTQLGESLSAERILARLGTLLAVFAALLAAIGAFALASQSVADRTRELSIRAACGASRQHLLHLVVRGSLRVSLPGIAIGLAVYWVASRWLEARLFGLGALDLSTLSLAVVGLLVTVTAAIAKPALRATRVESAVILRAE